jgi:release factor glutamine methyltransferase
MGDPDIQEARDALRKAGIPDPEREVVLLLQAATGQEREALYRDGPALSAGARAKFRELFRRRAAREPLAYLTGHREFYGLDLVVSPRVLIPRPETETLVETALRVMPDRPGRVVDVGTGSGAIALALASSGPRSWEVEAVDLDLGALAVARANRARLGVPIKVYPSDLLTQVEPGLLGVVANLPYVGPDDAVDPEVRFEPRQAVFAPDGGLLLIRRLISQVPMKLLAGGCLALEVGSAQAAAVSDAMREVGLDVGSPALDLAGQARVVWGVWRG